MTYFAIYDGSNFPAISFTKSGQIVRYATRGAGKISTLFIYPRDRFRDLCHHYIKCHSSSNHYGMILKKFEKVSGDVAISLVSILQRESMLRTAYILE